MLEIRWAQLQDARNLGTIHAESYHDTYKEIMPADYLHKISADERIKSFERSLASDPMQTAIMLVKGEAAGFMMLDTPEADSSRCAEITAIYLSTNDQGLGYGTSLLNWGLERLRERGYNEVILWVLEENRNAIRFYERQGFDCDDTVREIWRGTALRQVRYRKELKQMAVT